MGGCKGRRWSMPCAALNWVGAQAAQRGATRPCLEAPHNRLTVLPSGPPRCSARRRPARRSRRHAPHPWPAWRRLGHTRRRCRVLQAASRARLLHPSSLVRSLSCPSRQPCQRPSAEAATAGNCALLGGGKLLCFAAQKHRGAAVPLHVLPPAALLRRRRRRDLPSTTTQQ